MGDIKWVKFEVGMYDDTKLKILDSMENRDLHHYIWTRSLVLSGKINRGGYLYITDNIPYTIKTLAIEFNRSVEEIKSAYKVLRKLEMIEFTKDKVFKIKNWDKHQNVEGMERARQLNNDRVARCRSKKKELNEKIKEEEINDELEVIEEDKESNGETINNQDIQGEKDASKYINEDSENNINNISDSEDIAGNITKDKCNDICNAACNGENSDCNVTVTEQNKKEKEIKKEKKKESKSDIKTHNIENTSVTDLLKIQETSEKDNDKNKEALKVDETLKANKTSLLDNENRNNQEAANLLKHYENITGILGGLNLGLLKLAVEIHGHKNVKMAINRALEVNKANMTYINGILKNWKREGYPEDDREVERNGHRSSGKNSTADKKEFAGFKPKESRKLTEAERKRIQANLI